MKFRIKVNDIDGVASDARWETYDKDITDPKKWAIETLRKFNATLKPYEKARRLLEVEILERYSKTKHNWEKTNLVTIMKAAGGYDTYKCRQCGITGKRHGLQRITIDSRWKAEVYQNCNTAVEFINKRSRNTGCI